MEGWKDGRLNFPTILVHCASAFTCKKECILKTILLAGRVLSHVILFIVFIVLYRFTSTNKNVSFRNFKQHSTQFDKQPRRICSCRGPFSCMELGDVFWYIGREVLKTFKVARLHFVGQHRSSLRTNQIVINNAIEKRSPQLN